MSDVAGDVTPREVVGFLHKLNIPIARWPVEKTVEYREILTNSHLILVRLSDNGTIVAELRLREAPTGIDPLVRSTGIGPFGPGLSFDILQLVIMGPYAADSPHPMQMSVGFVHAPPKPDFSGFSWEHPDRFAKCQHWMDVRQRMLAVWERPRGDRQTGGTRREKTRTETVEELRRAVKLLSESLVKVEQGDDDHLDYIRGWLRALVYWEDRAGSHYSPTLFRLAAQLRLPLPVFGLPYSDKSFIYHPDAKQVFSPNGLSVTANTAFDELRDLQGWLEEVNIRYALTEPGSLTVAGEVASKGVTVIGETSNQVGISHHDSGVSSLVDRVTTDSPHYGKILLTEMGKVVVALSERVIEQVAEDGSE